MKKYLIVDNITEQTCGFDSVEDCEAWLKENDRAGSGTYSIYQLQKTVRVQEKVELVEVTEET